jgi:energy-converting hydrogenase Eha subunit E
MSVVVRKIKGIMLVSGALTTTMLYAALFPDAALQSTFGEQLSGPVAEMIVRNWGALIALVGIMLIYGAFNTATRELALLTAGTSKLAFIALVLANGSRYLSHGAGVAVVTDGIMVVLFIWYLLSVRHAGTRRAAQLA